MIAPLRIPIRSVPGYFLKWYYNGWHYWQFFVGTLGYKTDGIKYRTTGTRTIELSSGVLNYEQVEAIRSILNTVEVYLYTDGGWTETRLENGSVVVLKNNLQAYEVNIKANLGSRQVSATGLSPVLEIPEAPQPEYCEVIIGTQIWMCKNWDAAYPGSKVYNNDEANREIYGGLYQQDQMMSSGFCPDGWHIPSEEEWQTLIAFVGGTAVSGGKLKEAGLDHWNTPNTGADNAFGFTALGAGYMESNGVSYSLKEKTRFWTATTVDRSVSRKKSVEILYDDDTAIIGTQLVYNYHSVRMIKNEAAPAIPEWELQTSPIVGGRLYGVSFINSTIGWSVGYSGTSIVILSTADGGATWIQQTSPVVSGVLYSVHFTDVSNGWAVGYSGSNIVILVTSNGGVTWTQQTSPVASLLLYSVHFTDLNNGWAVGFSNMLILSTTNGGTTWTQQTSPVASGVLRGVYFINATTGWAVGYSVSNIVILSTTNGGTTWVQQTSPVTVGELYGIHFTDVNNGWAVGISGSNIVILSTSNGGATWVQQTSPVTVGALQSVNFINSTTGWTVGYNGSNIVILTTSDGGATWVQQTYAVTLGVLRSVYLIDANTGWTVGYSGSNIVILKYS